MGWGIQGFTYIILSLHFKTLSMKLWGDMLNNYDNYKCDMSRYTVWTCAKDVVIVACVLYKLHTHTHTHTHCDTHTHSIECTFIILLLMTYDCSKQYMIHVIIHSLPTCTYKDALFVYIEHTSHEASVLVCS